MIQSSKRIAIISGDHQVTYSEMLQRIDVFAASSPTDSGAKTLILSENREGWIYALYGVWKNGGIVVPVDAASTTSDIAYIIKDCKPSAIWVSDDRAELARRAIAKSEEQVEMLSIDAYEGADVAANPVKDFPAVEELGMQSTALICYTSGTTGSPKGVMLSFENVMANVRAVSTEVPIFNAERRTIVLLPLHHVLPLVGSAVIPFVVGGGVAISPSLAAADIMDTLQRGKIAIMIGVPRLWQTLYRGIKGKIDSNGLTRGLYSLCAKVKSRTLSRLVFRSVRAKMGGAITYCVAGGAALDTETAMGLKTLGLDVLEGYGMTEAAPMITFTRPGDIRPGCAGLPVPSVEVKLVDGELCARGRNVMQGYYNRPEETAAVVDSEGWLHTGDLATIDETMHVTITGRKKEIIVLSNGKNVNPTEIEEKIEHYAEIVKEAAVAEKDDMLCLIVVPQTAWMTGKTEVEMEKVIKEKVLQPYNTTVAPYKKLMSLHIHYGDLPRTRLEKLQRFKLRELIENAANGESQQTEESSAIFTSEGKIIADYIKVEKHVAVRPADNLETDLAMDSLDIVALQGFIEQTFGMKLTTEQLVAFANVETLAQYVATHKTREEVEELDWHKLLNEETDGAGKLPHMGIVGRVFMGVCRLLMRPLFHPESEGLENLPTRNGYILAPNHQSFIDGPLVVSALSKEVLEHTYFYAKRDHVSNPLARLVANNHNVIVMDMNTLSDSIHQLARVLRQGRNLVIFPEGTRTRTGEVGTFKKTVAILAQELGVPVVPVRIDGAFEAWPRTSKLPRCHKVKVTYRPSIIAQEGETYEQFAERVRACVL